MLRVLAFSDYRVQDISLLLDFVKGLQPKPDLILYAGDDVERFHSSGTNFFERLADLSVHGLCAVLGNDFPEEDRTDNGKTIRPLPNRKQLRAYIRGANVYNAQETPLIVSKYAIIGSEGSPPDPDWGDMGAVIRSEAIIGRHLRLAASSVRGKHLIVLSHCPPLRILDLAIRFGRRHVGSAALRNFISSHTTVSVVVCGHVHNCGARSQKFKHCTVVNAASHDYFGAPGRIAIIDLLNGKITSLRWQFLWDLLSICGIKESRAARLRNAGVSNVDKLAETSAEHIRGVLRCGSGQASLFRARALSLLKQDAVVLKKLELPERTRRAYIDIETDLRSKLIWLVGVHVEAEARTYSFFAQTPAHEKDILRDLLLFLSGRRELSLLSYSSCKVEQRLLPKRFSFHGLTTSPIERIMDTYGPINSCVAFPVEGTGLKDISSWCGFTPRYPEMDGWGAASTYGGGKVSKAESRMLITYNEDDLLALKHVIQYIEARSRGSGTAAVAGT